MTEEEQGPANADLLGTPEDYERTLQLATATAEAMQVNGIGQRIGDFLAKDPADQSADQPTEGSEWMAAQRVGTQGSHSVVMAARFPGQRWRTTVMTVGEWTEHGGADEAGTWRVAPESGQPLDNVSSEDAEALAHSLSEVAENNQDAIDIAGRPPFNASNLDAQQVTEQYGSQVSESDLQRAQSSMNVQYGYSTPEVEAAKSVAQQDLLTRMYGDLQLQDAAH